MKVLCVIPARAGATRFPGKPLALLRGRALLARVWDRVAGCPRLDRVVIATDDEAILAAARGWGAEAVMTRPDHESGTDRVAEVASRAEYADYGVVANVQGDEPLLDCGDLWSAIAPVHEGKVPMSTLAREEDDPEAFASPHVVKVVVDGDANAVLFSRSPTGPAPPFLRHVGTYVFARETLLAFTRLAPSPAERAERLEQLRALGHGIRLRVVLAMHDSRGVDTPADLELLERDWDTWARPFAPPRETPR